MPWPQPAAIGIPLCVGLYLLAALFPIHELPIPLWGRWCVLVGSMAVAATVYFILAWFFVLPREDRNELAAPVAARMTRWAILTGEYPPDPGGVSDYTRLIARELVRMGDGVCVYAPSQPGPVDSDDAGVRVHRLPGVFGPLSLSKLDAMLARAPRPDRILVQYVPHAFGYKAMNVPFCAWLACRPANSHQSGSCFTKSPSPLHRRHSSTVSSEP